MPIQVAGKILEFVVSKILEGVLGAAGEEVFRRGGRSLLTGGGRQGSVRLYHPTAPHVSPVLRIRIETTQQEPSPGYAWHGPYYELHIENTGSGLASRITIDPIHVQHTDFRTTPTLQIEGEIEFKQIGSLALGQTERLSVTHRDVARTDNYYIGTDHLFAIMLQQVAGGRRRRIRIRFESLDGIPLAQDVTLKHIESEPSAVLRRHTSRALPA
jgi:hypothetical protein